MLRARPARKDIRRSLSGDISTLCEIVRESLDIKHEVSRLLFHSAVRLKSRRDHADAWDYVIHRLGRLQVIIEAQADRQARAIRSIAVSN